MRRQTHDLNNFYQELSLHASHHIIFLCEPLPSDDKHASNKIEVRQIIVVFFFKYDRDSIYATKHT